MRIQSLHSIKGITFGSPSSALSSFGPPLEETTSELDETEFAYDHIIFRFDATGLVEVSFLTPSELSINGDLVPLSGLLPYLKKNDPEYFEHVGFAICPRLGFAYDLDHEGCWTTVFKEGHWDAVRSKK